MRTSSLLLFLLTMAWPGGCSNADLDADPAVHAAMDRQVQAWNAGDVAGFMVPYADTACFISGEDRTCGKVLVEGRYKVRYPDAAAMGRLSFSQLEVVPTGADHAWCTGRWRLLRADDTLSGGFSLLWQRLPDGWRIIRDHTY